MLRAGKYLLHEVKEDVQQLGYEGLHLLQAVTVKGIYEAAQCHHCIHSHLRHTCCIMSLHIARIYAAITTYAVC